MAIQDMTTAAPPATAEMPHPLAVAVKYRVSPSPVHVEMREDPERAAGGAWSLRLRCTLTSSYEQHIIGGPGPEVADEEGPTVYESSLELDGVLDLRSHDDACRAAVLGLLSAIRIPGAVSLLDPAAGEWYEPVVRDIVGQLLTSGEEETRGGYALDVSLSIQESIRYVQPEALLLACEHAAAAIPASQLAPDERCAVCMERFPAAAAAAATTDDARPAVCTDEDKAFSLPACRHTFHRGCVAAWFEKGSTCPLCRCDMMYCLIAVEKQFGIR